MPTMTTSETVAVHQHKCAKCGEVFNATCGHLVFNDSNLKARDLAQGAAG
jgi:hypothetical protein